MTVEEVAELLESHGIRQDYEELQGKDDVDKLKYFESVLQKDLLLIEKMITELIEGHKSNTKDIISLMSGKAKVSQQFTALIAERKKIEKEQLKIEQQKQAERLITGMADIMREVLSGVDIDQDVKNQIASAFADRLSSLRAD